MEPEYTIVCPNCDAELTVGGVRRASELRCSECGGGVELPRTGYSERRVHARTRSVVNREIGRAYRALESIRVVCIVMAVISGFLVLRITGRVLQGDDGGEVKSWIDLFVPDNLQGGVWGGVKFWLNAILPVVILATSIVAAVRLPREGALWTGLCAVATTALVVLVGPGPFLLFAFMALGSWVALGTVVKVRPLLDKYPDLRIAKKMRGQTPRG